VIGGGIVGCAVARELAGRGLEVAVLEKEDELARHASGRNSGVLHSGVFNRAGTLKAEMTRRGLPEMIDYCRARGVPHKITGKVVTAGDDGDLAPLERLRKQGEANGLAGLEVRPPERIGESEAHAAPRPHLFVPQTGVVDSVALVRAIAKDASSRGAVFHMGTRVIEVERRDGGIAVATDRGEFTAPQLVNAAGLHADEVAWQLGAADEFVIVPFRGDNYEIVGDRAQLIRGLLYPLKDPERPFVGVHFTKRTDGGVLVGPNAVIPPHREAYGGMRPRRETIEMALDPAFVRMLLRNRAVARHAPRELLLSLSPRAFLEEARKLVPSLRAADLRPARSGIRAQLVRREDGALVDDVVLEPTEGALHILNAVSPALTNALAFAEHVADRLPAR
jgi:L-2-hydroxyglutarate oxidase LhgO